MFGAFTGLTGLLIFFCVLSLMAELCFEVPCDDSLERAELFVPKVLLPLDYYRDLLFYVCYIYYFNGYGGTIST